MRGFPLRTISGRIVAGFVLLLCMFGVVGGYTIFQMNRLGRALRFIRVSYLEVSPRVAQLQIWQAAAVDALDQDNPPKPTIGFNREKRGELLAEADAHLSTLTDVPASYAARVSAMRDKIRFLLTEHKANEVLFQAAFGTDRNSEEARTARKSLRNRENKLQNDIKTWFQQLQRDAASLTEAIARAERRARLGALALGGAAVAAALLVAAWAVLTLRPLRRLRDGARRVAAGDYRERVDVAGGTEVAELADEFNNMAAAIEEREQELVRSERLAAVGKMAAVITHEVRNPLSSIGLNAELLEEEIGRVAAGGPPAEAEGLLRAVQKEVDRLTAITEEYLRFARLPRPKLEREQVNAIVSGLVEFQREELALRGVTVEANLAADVPPVAADEAQLRQALLNLVRNAAEAMSGNGGGALTLATDRAPDGAVEVRVSDSGPGIAPELVGRIFEPFFSTKEGGTGLGLALTQQIIAEHGGRIDVQSAPGRGTTFVVRLPAAAA